MASARIMYGDEAIDAAFERVHNHYGQDYKVTEVLRNLVRDKAREIGGELTRRDQIAGMREDITALSERVAALERAVADLPSLIECMLSELVEARAQ